MEELVLYLARALVDQPQAVEVRTSDVEGGKLLELKVAPDDVGKVIGRDGRTVNAIRSLLTSLAQRQGVKARLEVLDDKKMAASKNGAHPAPADA